MKRGAFVWLKVLFLTLSLPLAVRAAKDSVIRLENLIAVMDIELGAGVDPALKAPLTQAIIDELVHTGKYQVIDRANRDKILKEQGFQLSECVSEECRVQAGRLLGVGKLVVGYLYKVGRVYFVTLQVINVETGKIEHSIKHKCPCSVEELLDVVPPLASKMVMGKISKRSAEPSVKTARVKISSTPSGASVEINGEDRGKTPLTITLPYGDYRLEVYKPGYKRTAYTLRVKKSQVNVNVTLRKLPAKIDIVSSPSGAKVIIDGKVLGKTPLTDIELEEGKHTLELELKGYKPLRKEITLKAGERRTFMETLRKIRGERVTAAKPATGKKPLWKTILGWSGVTIGAICIGLGTYQLIESKKAMADADEAYDNYFASFTPDDIQFWWEEVTRARDRAKESLIIGSVLLGAGAAATGAGLYGFLSPAPSKRVDVRASLLRDGFIIAVRFKP